MPVPVIIPKATITMEEAVILKWLKSEGEAVAKDDLLFEMETDKAIMEVPAPESGTVLRILMPQGPVKVEQIVGWIGEPGERVEAPAVPAAPATPAARRRARELGMDVAALTGTGPGGRIVQEDVERAAQSTAVHPRSALIRRLTETWRAVPHIHIARLMDARGLIQAREKAPPESTITDLLLFLLARLLPDFPELTLTWSGDGLAPARRLDLAFAVDTERGVAAPVIHDALSISLPELGARRRALTEAARLHRLKIEDLEGGVFTLSNLGMQDVDFFAPVINAPQTAMLAVGRAAEQPVAAEGAVTLGWRMWANLALDHRAADGALAARFLAQLQCRIDQLPQEVGRIS